MSERTYVATVHGFSDHLIEVNKGALRDEYDYEDVPAYLSFPDGTILRVEYTRWGPWRIVVHRAGIMRCEIKTAPEDDEDQYSDVATLFATDPAHLAWCRYSTARPGEEVMT